MGSFFQASSKVGLSAKRQRQRASGEKMDGAQIWSRINHGPRVVTLPSGHSHPFHVTFGPHSRHHLAAELCASSCALPLHAPLPARRPPMQARSERRRRLHKVSTSCCTYAAASYCSRAIERLSVSITLACMHLPASSSSPSPSPTPPSLHRHPVPSHPQPRLSPHHPTLFLHRPV